MAFVDLLGLLFKLPDGAGMSSSAWKGGVLFDGESFSFLNDTRNRVSEMLDIDLYG